MKCPLGCPSSGQNVIKCCLFPITISRLSVRWSPNTYCWWHFFFFFYFFFAPHPQALWSRRCTEVYALLCLASSFISQQLITHMLLKVEAKHWHLIFFMNFTHSVIGLVDLVSLCTISFGFFQHLYHDSSLSYITQSNTPCTISVFVVFENV